MFNIRKKIIFSFISSLMILSLLACSSGATPESPDIEATVQARVKATLDSMPTPTPKVVFVTKEVSVEKIVEVIKEVIKEVEVPVEKIVEVIKEVEVEVIKEVIKEVIVEKIVEVVVTATPTPTPIPTPTATPTPLPDISEYLEVNMSMQTTTVDLLPSSFAHIEPTPYLEGLVTNNHPTLGMYVVMEETITDNEGFIMYDKTYGHECIFPKETRRFRRSINKTNLQSSSFVESDDNHQFEVSAFWDIDEQRPSTDVFPIQMQCSELFEENIDESLLDEVELNITKIDTWAFTVEMKNPSARQIFWEGELLIKDEFGYTIVRDKVGLRVYPNRKNTKTVRWGLWDDMIGDVSVYYLSYSNNEVSPLSDLNVKDVNLRTISLYAEATK